jgi:hypothetical protein
MAEFPYVQTLVDSMTTVSIEHAGPVYMYRKDNGEVERPFVRLLWRMRENAYLPVTFLCDTGAPGGLYLNSEVMARVSVDGEMGTTLHCEDGACLNASVSHTPLSRHPQNIIGLNLLMRLCLIMEESDFSFRHKIKWIGN